MLVHRSVQRTASANSTLTLARTHCAWLRMTPRPFPQHRLTKRLSRITILPRAAPGTALPARFSHPLRSSSQLHSLRLVSLSRRRRRTSQLASPATFAPVPLRQELNALAA